MNRYRMSALMAAMVAILFMSDVAEAGRCRLFQRFRISRRWHRVICCQPQPCCRPCEPVTSGYLCPQTKLGVLKDANGNCQAILYYCEECYGQYVTVETSCQQGLGTCGPPANGCLATSTTGGLPAFEEDIRPPQGRRRYLKELAEHGLPADLSFESDGGCHRQDAYLQRGQDRRDVRLIRCQLSTGEWVGVGFEISGNDADEKIVVTNPLTPKGLAYWVKDGNNYWYVVYLHTPL